MTLRTICQQVFREVGGLDVPGAIAGSSDKDAIRALALAQRGGKQLARHHDFPELLKIHTFTTTAAALQANGIPDDFGRAVPLTFWDRSNYWEMIGPAIPQEWQFLNSASVVASPRRWYEFRRGNLYIFPTPASTTDTISYFYFANQWCQSESGTGQAAWVADTDTGVIDEEILELDLKWRLLHSLGEPYQEAKTEASDTIAQHVVAEKGGAAVVDFQHMTGRFQFIDNFPETGVGT